MPTTQTIAFAISEFKFDARSRRYRWTDGAGKGSFASKTAVLNRSKALIVQRSNELVGLADQLVDGAIDLKQFQRQAAEKLKEIHILQGVVGAEGIERLTSEDYLSIGRTLKLNYYAGRDADTGRRWGLKHLAAELRSGTVSLPQLKARLKLYAQSGKVSYWDVQTRAKKRSGVTEGRRLPTPSDRACAECVAFAGLGWQSIEDVVLPATRCSCLGNCRCRIEYR